MNCIKVSEKEIGGNKTFIVAEIGANHNNDITTIKKIIDKAKECGVDAVKFQTYTARDLLVDYDRVLEYESNGVIKNKSIGALFDELALPRQWHEEIFQYAKKQGLIAFSTPFSIDGVRFLNEINVPIFKVAASDVNYVDMLIELSKHNKPIILSLGKCTLSEADRAIEILKSNGVKQLIIMHCVSKYPSPMEEMNLNVIKSLKVLYPDLIIGFSDHSTGITASLGAVALGAKVIEKHFTLDKTLEGPDHWFSMDPSEMKSLVDGIRDLEKAFGDSRKRVLECEKDEREKSIRSLVIKNSKKAGETIEEEDLLMLRPGYGISPFDKDKVIGMKLSNDKNSMSVLQWKDFK